MAVNHWLRWYHGTTTDPKFRTIACKAGCHLTAVIAIWAFLLEQASQSDERGSISGIDPDDVSQAIDIDRGVVDRIMDAMRGKVLSGDGDLIVAWEKRQPKREDETAADRKKAQRSRESSAGPMTGAERMRALRERKKKSVTSDEDVTKCDVTCVTRDESVTSRRHIDRHADADNQLNLLDKSDVTDVTQCHAIGEERRGKKNKSVTPYSPPEGDDGFAAFWRAYPRKVGKGQAERAYAKAIKLASPETILTAAQRYASERAGQDPQYTRHPATWLNGKGWEDEPAKQERSTHDSQSYDERRRAEQQRKSDDDDLKILEALGLAPKRVDDSGPFADWDYAPDAD
jgi:hypothetical protein